MIMIRNDIDVIGVRAGCTFTGYSDSSFNGQRMTIRAEGYDRLTSMSIPIIGNYDNDSTFSGGPTLCSPDFTLF